MSDLIERSAVIDLMRTNWADNDGDTAMQLSIDDVRNLPAVPKQRTGKWIHHEDIIGLGGYYRCSCCAKRALYYKSETAWINTPTRYCPNCGAKMEGASE